MSLSRIFAYSISVFIELLFMGESAYSADLLSLYQDALGYDAQYAAARALRDAEVEKQPQALAGLLPNLSLNANSTWTAQHTTLRVADAETIVNRYNDKGWSAQLAQPIFRWQNWVSYKQAQLTSISAEIQFEKSKQDLIIKVAEAYFNVLVARAAVATNKAQLQALHEQLEAANRNYALGITTIADSYEAQSRFDLAGAQKVAVINDLSIKEKTLKNICGSATHDLKDLREDVHWEEPKPPVMAFWSDAATRENLDIKVGEGSLEIANREIERRRSNHFPILDLIGTYQRTAYSTALSSGIERPGSNVEASAVGLQISMPLYSGGSVTSQVREATALREKALDDLIDVKRTAILSAEKSYQDAISGIMQIKAYEAALTSSEAAMKANKRGYELGIRVNIDVLNAQGQLFDTKLKLIKSRFDTLLAQLKLKASVGALGDSDVLDVNALFE